MEECVLEEMTVIHSNTTNHEQLLDTLMHAYGQDILQLVYAYVHDKTLAEDLTQEIFVKCYQALSHYKGQSQMKTWLWRIAINHTKDYLKSWHHRHIQVTEDVILQAVHTSDNVEQSVVQQDIDSELAQTVMQLPVKYRELIYLFYFEEWKIKDIAHVLGRNENTVKSRLRKAKQLLKERLEASAWTND